MSGQAIKTVRHSLILTGLLTVLVSCVFVHPVYAQNPPVPDVIGWKETKRMNIELKTPDKFAVFSIQLGFWMEYRNPDNPNEFVIIIKRCVPFVAAKPESMGMADYRGSIMTNFASKEESDLLAKLIKESDPIIYIRGEEISFTRTDGKQLKRPSEAWFLLVQQGDSWLYGELGNGGISQEVVSEPYLYGVRKLALIGIRYSFKDAYHILRIDQEFLNPTLFFRPKGDVQ